MRNGSTEEKTFQGHLKNVTSKGGGGPQDQGPVQRGQRDGQGLSGSLPLHTHWLRSWMLKSQALLMSMVEGLGLGPMGRRQGLVEGIFNKR